MGVFEKMENGLKDAVKGTKEWAKRHPVIATTAGGVGLAVAVFGTGGAALLPIAAVGAGSAAVGSHIGTEIERNRKRDAEEDSKKTNVENSAE